VRLNVIVHGTGEGGYWAEVLAVPGCATREETLDGSIANVAEAIEGCLRGE